MHEVGEEVEVGIHQNNEEGDFLLLYSLPMPIAHMKTPLMKPRAYEHSFLAMNSINRQLQNSLSTGKGLAA